MRVLDILEPLIAFPTVSSASNLDLIDWAQAHLTAAGFRVDRFVDANGQKAGIYAEIGPAGPGVLLSAHTDVVPVEGQVWTRDPFRLTREGDRVFGRGTTDMKGYVACMLALAERAAGAALREPLKIVLSYDEEIGCVGVQNMQGWLAERVGQPRACFVGEPTEMQVAIGHKGKAGLRGVFDGVAGHSALAPNFTNALYVASDFITELRGLQTELAQGARDAAYDIPYSTVHVGKLQGGMALNIVPDRAEMLFEYRHLPADRAEDLMARITAAARRVEARFDKAGIQIERYMGYPGLEVPEDAAIVRAGQRLAQSNETTKVAFGTEAGVFEAMGIPTVVCGPGSMEAQGHKADESIAVADLAACDAMMDRVLADLTG